MARYEVSRENPENENYLEGLRDEDRRRQLEDVRYVKLSGNIEEDTLKEHRALMRQHDTLDNWRGITTDRFRRDGLPGDDFSRPQYHSGETSVRIPNENEYLPGMSSYEMHPIKHDSSDINISKQLVEHVDRLSRMQARRPPTDYHVESTHNGYTGEGSARLIHTPTGKRVGIVEWSKDSGYVNNLEVNEGHRHMTNYLLTQTWNQARAAGDKGPASSDILSPFSEKIVQKYNPDSHDFRLFKANKAMTCDSCEGDGEVRLTATPSEDGRHVNYSEPSGTVGENVSNTLESRNHFARTIEHRYDVYHQSGGVGVHNPQTGTSHYWHDYHIRCPKCHGTGLGQMIYE